MLHNSPVSSHRDGCFITYPHCSLQRLIPCGFGLTVGGFAPAKVPFFTHAFGHLVVAMTLPAVLYKASTVTDLACTQVVCVLGQQELFGSQV